ncbi:MAG: Ig-like domain-containing protein, partial [Cyanobacteria bacterium P01_A01_bin.3]
MPASNNPIQNTNPLAPSLGDDELSTGGLLEQATLDSSSFSNSGNSEPVGNSFQSKDIDELPPLEVIPLSQEDPDTLFRGAAPSIAPPPVSRRTPQQFQQEATTVFDALTGTTSSDLGLGDSTSAAPIEFADSVTLSDLMTPSEMFTILAEGRVVVAEGGDFDGDPLNPVDDARIYAGNGFNFRRTPILPAQLDAEGNPVLDGDGNPVLISNAVSVAANYAVARAKDNPYSNLTPPQVVEAQTVAVPDFEQIKAVELGSRLSEDDTIIEYRPRRRDLDTAAEWQENFPPAGTVDAPTIVRIAQGGLRVPDGVDLRNTIIIAETGGIRFEGENHKLDNVVLIAEQKAINLGKAHVTNSSILAKRTVRMDSQARFSGRNVLANGDAEYGLRLDGSTTSTDAENELTVIAQGRLVYNSVSDTRARLVAGQTIRFNTPSLLVGSVHSKGDIRFTQDITVVAAPAGPLPDTVAPVLNAGLSNDTGRDDADGITSDPSISGVVIDDGEVGGLVARFANGLSTEFVDVSSSLQADGSFNFTPAQLATIYGGELPDGTLVLQLLAQDSWGNLSQPVQMIFELDRVAPEAEAPDLVGGGTSGDGYGTTNAEIVRFSIDAEIGSQIRLTMPFEGDRLVAEGVATEATTVLAAEGLEEGYLDIVATVIDAAGNTATSDYLSFIVDREAHGLSVDNLTDGSTIEEGARLQGSIAGSRSEVASLSYQFEGMPAVDIPLNQDRSFDVAIDAAGLVDGPQTLTVTVVDNAGNESAIAVQVTIAGTVAPALTAGLSNDTGRDDADGITSDPSVSGAVADDREVSGLVARFAEGLNAEFVDVSSSLQADGSFSFTTTQLETIYGGELPDGALTLQLRAQDSSGNLSEPVQMSFELDRVAPDAETPELVDGGISGDGYGTTNAESVRFSIDAEVGSQIQLFLYGQLIAEGVATEGTTILTAGQLEEGYLDITAIVTDAAGNTAESDYLSFIVDREAHELTVDNLTDGSTIEEGARLQGGIAGLSSEVASLSYQFDGMPAIDIPLNRDKSFDVEIDATGLVDGPQTLTVSVVDNAGNESTISVDVTIAVTGDIEPPTITAELLVDTGESDSDGLTNQAGITGSVIDESAISALRVGFSGTSEFVDVIDSLNSDGTFVLSAEQLEQINGGELPDGNYTVQIVAVDSEGNVADPVEVSFVLDTSGPVVNLIAPIADADVSATARAVGSVDATAISTQIAVNGGDSRELVLDGGGGFDTLLQTAPLSEGANQVTVTATDLAGNQTEALVEFRVAPDFIVGPNAGQGWAMASDDGIQLSERDSFVVQASQALDIPLAAGSRTLRFDLEANFDTSDAGAIEDQLLIYLVDPATGETLLGNGETGTAVLSLVGERAEFTAGLVRFNSGTVEIDLTGLTGVDRAQLVVQLVNADGDTGSTARLSNMVVDIEPDGEGQQVIETTDAIADIAGGLDIDSLTVAPADDVNVQVRNVRLDAETGLYTAQVRIRNRGEETLGRQVAVVFDDLPAGVQLVNASGVDRDGNPYINLQNAIRAGGLETGRNSDFVTISFENADLLRFGINPTVFLGDGNQSPVFEVIPPLEVMPGGRVELPLVATDADGDVVTFRIEPNGSLPKGSLSGDRLVFQPQLDELGTYTFTLIATDGSATVRQEVTLNVVPDPITTTRLSGTIASTLTDPETGADLNLGNVRVALGELETVTDADGSFTLDLPTGFSGGEVLKVYGDSIDGNYPVIAEAVASALGQEGIAGVNNVLARPIYLSPIDPGDGQSVDPMDDTVITTANLPGATLTIDAGSLKSPDGSGQLADYTGTVSITQVPVDRLPASLPPTLSPDVVVLVQAGGVVFETPAALVLPNSADYAPGTEMELYGIDSETGEFEVVGTGVVSADGSVIETTNGGVDDSGWYFFAPATAGSSIAQADIDFNLGVGRRRQSTPVAGTSAVDLHAGELTEEHQLVGYYSQGVNRSLQLSYDSSRANPTASVAFGRKDIGASSADDYLTARLRLELGGFEYSLPNRSIGGSASSQHVWRLPDTGSGQTVGGSIQANLQNLETGAYRYSVESGVQRRVGSEFVGSVDLTSGELIVINGVDSLLGAGWGIAGTQEIVATSGGAVLLIDGDGTELLFTEPVSNGAGGMLFESPNGDYSTLEQLSDGTFRRTTKDQTVYDFNADNQLISVTDRNGNIHRHNYDSQGRLVSMVDPVGLETTLSYGSDGKV